MTIIASEFFDLSTDIMCILDVQWSFLRVNRAWTEGLGWTEEELLGQAFLSFVHPEDVKDARKQEPTQGTPWWVFENRYLHKDGSHHYLRWTVRFDEKRSAYFVTARDVSEEKKTEKNLGAMKRELSVIFDGVPTFLSHWTRDLHLINANKAFLRFVGRTLKDAVGRHAQEILGEQVYAENIQSFIQALDGEEHKIERQVVGPLGALSFLMTYIPEWEGNKVVGVFSNMTDITELRSSENLRRQAEAKVISTSRLTQLGEMAAGIAHEVNNPLTVIQGNAERLRTLIEKGRYDEDEFTRILLKIESTVGRISKIISGLRNFARDADNDPPSLFPVRKSIEEALELCRERFVVNGVKLDFEFESEFNLMGRGVQISQVVANLLGNSFDAVQSLAERWVRVRVYQDAYFGYVEVIDSGHGIPPEVVEKMMQPFFTTKEVGKGTGLGLSISKGIVEAHNGVLEYDPEHHHTRFILRLPLSEKRTVFSSPAAANAAKPRKVG